MIIMILLEHSKKSGKIMIIPELPVIQLSFPLV
ncbi:hypothetical protein J2T12_000008 [Paenibacillus anaericanus]|nr:hypothetical protein [Paenibacillus anaericanus]